MKVPVQIPTRETPTLMTARHGEWLARRTLAFQLATSLKGGPANRFQYPSASKAN